MTTARQVKALVRPLLERHHDLILVAPMVLCLLPIHHVARLIIFDRASMASYFNLEWRLSEHFIPEVWWKRTCDWCYEGIPRSPESREEGSGGGNWYWADPTMSADFVAQVETVALPLLRSLNTLEASAAFTRHHLEAKWCMGAHWQIAVDAALGNIDAARAMWETIRPRHEAILSGPKRGQGRDRFREIADALIANDRVALARILHLVEAEHIAGSPLEPYWQSVPFPLEA